MSETTIERASRLCDRLEQMRLHVSADTVRNLIAENNKFRERCERAEAENGQLRAELYVRIVLGMKHEQQAIYADIMLARAETAEAELTALRERCEQDVNEMKRAYWYFDHGWNTNGMMILNKVIQQSADAAGGE